jgi:L-amino acid N-acyltransferase YncA
MNFAIDALTSGDWPQVRSIYQDGIATGNATFETAAPEWEQWDAGHLAAPRLAARSEEGLIGWAVLSPVSTRVVYAGVSEVSVYVSGEARGRGVGLALLEALIRASEEAGIWTLQAGIFPENVASLALFARCGFRRLGVRVRVGRHHNGWRDVILMERRSANIGID